MGVFFEIFDLDRSIRFENLINERNKVRNSMKASKLSSFVGWKFVVSDPGRLIPAPGTATWSLAGRLHLENTRILFYFLTKHFAVVACSATAAVVLA